MTVEMVEYRVTQRLLDLIDRETLDHMAQQALSRWQQRKIELGNGVFACRMMAGPHLVVFFMIEHEGKVHRQLLLWEEAVEKNLSPIFERLFKTGDVKDGPAAFLREFLSQGGRLPF